jgi:hypothetical protein
MGLPEGQTGFQANVLLHLSFYCNHLGYSVADCALEILEKLTSRSLVRDVGSQASPQHWLIQ